MGFGDFATESSFRTGRIDWSCGRCGYKGRLRVTTAVVAARSRLGMLLGALDASGIEVPGGGHMEGDRRRLSSETERRFQAAGRLVRCPRCGKRDGSAFAWLMAQVCAIGLVVGLIGVVPGLLGAAYLGMELQGSISGTATLLGAIGGELIAGTIATWLTLRRRLSDVDASARFLRPDEEDDESSS